MIGCCFLFSCSSRAFPADGSGFEAIKISMPGEDAANGEQGKKQEA